MNMLLRQLWVDDRGFIVSAELVVVATVLILGLIVGMTCLQTALIGEFRDLGFAFSSLDQSYFFQGRRGCFSRWGRSAWTSGSGYYDAHLRGTVAADFAVGGADFGVGAVDYGCTNCETGSVVEEHVDPIPEPVPCPDCVPVNPPCDDCEPAAPPCSMCPPEASLPVPPSPAAAPDPGVEHYPPMTVPAY